jgi:hypothetical protein
MKNAIGLLALTLAATSEVGLPESSYYVVPPPEFDHPYDGVLKVTTARDQNHVRELCPDAKFSPHIGALGCAHVQIGSCWIILAPDAATQIGRAGPAPRDRALQRLAGGPLRRRTVRRRTALRSLPRRATGKRGMG